MGEVARRPRADAERNRRRLLDAAAELFGERGLDVGVAEIAQRAGVGRGTLFRNFPTKQDLVVAAVLANELAECGPEPILERLLDGHVAQDVVNGYACLPRAKPEDGGRAGVVRACLVPGRR